LLLNNDNFFFNGNETYTIAAVGSRSMTSYDNHESHGASTVAAGSHLMTSYDRELLRKGLWDNDWLPIGGKRAPKLDRSDDIMGKAQNDSVMRLSLHKLRPGVWLNDEAIHYYFVLLRLRDEQLCRLKPGRRRCHFFKSYFLTKLLEDDKRYNYDNVRRWSRRQVPGEDIFALDKVFLL
jgi:hypothetical protein